MHILVYILIFIASCFVLIKSGTLLVKSLVKIAKFLQWNEFFVSFILVSFVTTIPEFFIGVISAINGEPELSFGNILGSNIINLTLAVAIGVFVARGIECKKSVILPNLNYMAIAMLLPVVLMVDRNLSRVDGFILLVFLFIYLFQLFYQKQRFSKAFIDGLREGSLPFRSFLREIFLFFGAGFLILLSAQGIVWSASSFSKLIFWPLAIVGSIIVALGTNLPEITFGVKSALMGHKDMILGDLIGAVVVNSTLVLGTTFLISPLKITNFSIYLPGIIFSIISVLFFLFFARTARKISIKEALFLLTIYFAFIASQSMVKF